MLSAGRVTMNIKIVVLTYGAVGSAGNDDGNGDDVIEEAWTLTSPPLSESVCDSCLTLLR